MPGIGGYQALVELKNMDSDVRGRRSKRVFTGMVLLGAQPKEALRGLLLSPSEGLKCFGRYEKRWTYSIGLELSDRCRPEEVAESAATLGDRIPNRDEGKPDDVGKENH